jgi:hypothetical protein
MSDSPDLSRWEALDGRPVLDLEAWTATEVRIFNQRLECGCVAQTIERNGRSLGRSVLWAPTCPIEAHRPPSRGVSQ